MENDSTAISNITNVSQEYNSGNYLIYAVLFIVGMLSWDASRTLLPRTALGKVKRHAMHNAKITIHHFHFDDMETLHSWCSRKCRCPTDISEKK
jgi:hypothetical protein